MFMVFIYPKNSTINLTTQGIRKPCEYLPGILLPHSATIEWHKPCRHEKYCLFITWEGIGYSTVSSGTFIHSGANMRQTLPELRILKDSVSWQSKVSCCIILLQWLSMPKWWNWQT